MFETSQSAASLRQDIPSSQVHVMKLQQASQTPSLQPQVNSQKSNNTLVLNSGARSFVIPNKDAAWGNSVDQRLDVLQNALESVLTIFQNNRIEQEQQINLLQTQLHRERQLLGHSQRHEAIPSIALPSLSEIIPKDYTEVPITDFRISSLLALDEAEELLLIFCTRMSAHMFGYHLQELLINELWERSPILLIAICTVACPHHPTLASKQKQLLSSLNWFSSQLLNCGENIHQGIEMEHSILALIIASLWLQSNQLYVSIALHLARIWRIDQYQCSKGKNELWKLWDLLYILDGTQNLISHKSPSIYKQTEPIIKSARKDLIDYLNNPNLKKVLEENDIIGKSELATNKQLLSLNEVDHEKIPVNSSQLQDIRLCGLVEYHMAIESLFGTKNLSNTSLDAASSLLQPSKFGIPWQNNMDLDKWMISWTIALQSINVQNDAWCLKSTLLYYNFARMHINTRWLLDRRTPVIGGSQDKSNWFDIWSSKEASANSTLIDASHEISLSAATSLLKLVTKDKDINSLFQFLPNHIYLMLFYASMVVLEPPLSLDLTDALHIKKLKRHFNLVRTFREMLASGTSSDTEFTKRLLLNVGELMTSFIDQCIKVVKVPNKDSAKIQEIIQEPDSTAFSDSNRKTISAWPSVNHGHP